jgi:hypothetical protein
VADYYFNTVRKGYPPLRFLNAGFSAGVFHLDFSGPPTVLVEASTNLLDWQSVGTATPHDGFNDSASSEFSRRFYRLRLP